MVVTASEIGAFLRRFSDAYAAWMQPLNQQHQLPPNGLDILLFLANNPGKDTARDICRCRQLKPGLVSITVEKLVQAGYLQRQGVPGDRRKDRLVCTPAAAAIIEEGRRQQEAFGHKLNEGLTKEDADCILRCLTIVDQNLKQIGNKEDPSHAKQSTF